MPSPSKYRDMAERLGFVVRTLRRRRGINQAELAREIGQTRTSVVNIESGRYLTSLSNFVLIAQALGVEPHVLMRSMLDAKAELFQQAKRAQRARVTATLGRLRKQIRRLEARL